MLKVPKQFFEYVRQVDLDYPEECSQVAMEVYKLLLPKFNIDLTTGLSIQIGTIRKCVQNTREQFKEYLIAIHDILLREKLNPTQLTQLSSQEEKNDIIDFSKKVFIENKKFNKEYYLKLFKVYEACLNSNQGVAQVIQRQHFGTILENLLISYIKNLFIDKYPNSEFHLDEIFKIIRKPLGDVFKPYEFIKTKSSEQSFINYVNTITIHQSMKNQNGKLYAKTDSLTNTGFIGFTAFTNLIRSDLFSFELKLELTILMNQFIEQYSRSNELDLTEIIKQKAENNELNLFQSEFQQFLKQQKDIKAAFINLSKRLKSLENCSQINARQILQHLVNYDILSKESLPYLKQATFFLQKNQNSNQTQTKKIDVGSLRRDDPKSDLDQHCQKYEHFIKKREETNSVTVLTLINDKQISIVRNLQNYEFEYYVSNSKFYKQFKEAINDLLGQITKN